MGRKTDPVPGSPPTETGSSGKILMKKPFHKLFSHGELVYYGIAALVYISLGVLFQNPVLNFAVGPLFIVLWMWWVPVLMDKWKARKS